LGDFFENFSILEVEIGRNGPGILGVKVKRQGEKEEIMTFISSFVFYNTILLITLYFM
jgi:hypothetical protein